VDSDLGRTIKEHLDTNTMIPLQILFPTLNVVDPISELTLLDGFPRRVDQAQEYVKKVGEQSSAV